MHGVVVGRAHTAGEAGVGGGAHLRGGAGGRGGGEGIEIVKQARITTRLLGSFKVM